MSINTDTSPIVKMQEAVGYVHLAQKHVSDLQQIYDAANSSLSMAKMQLNEFERRLKEREEDYRKSTEWSWNGSEVEEE